MYGEIITSLARLRCRRGVRPVPPARAWPRPGIFRAGGLLMLALIAAAAVPGTARGTCAGDCDGNGAVTIQELILAVNIALDSAVAGDCMAVDSNHDGRVTIDEIIAAVQNALNGCGATPTPTFAQGLLITGGCAQPGPGGLIPCAAGTGIIVWRCDANATCIDDIQSRTQLGAGAVGAGGGFAITVDATKAGQAALLMQASVSHTTLFRTMGFGAIGGSSVAFARAAAVTVNLSVTIDPSTEAAIRLLDAQGLDQFAPEGVLAIIAAVRAANLSTSFAGLDPEAAAEKALAVARSDPGVQEALLTYRFTATPTATGSATATITASVTATATASSLATATATRTASATATASPLATATATRTASATGTATATPPATGTATRTASPTATPTTSSTPTVTRTHTASATATRTATPPATATSTRTASLTATLTATRTSTASATVTRTATATRTITSTATATRTRTATGTATATRTASSTGTVTLTRTPTHTPTPFLQAQLTTDPQGCLETGQNAAYKVGEQANVLFEVEGVYAGMSVAQVDVKIADYSNCPGPNCHLVDVTDFGSRPTGAVLGFGYLVRPPTGTETLQLLANATPIPLTAQTQCSFSVLPAAQCMTACDCPSGEPCSDMGSCIVGASVVYCCTSGNCPLGASCQNPDGGFGQCSLG